METGYAKNTGPQRGLLVDETDLEIIGKNTSTFKIKQNSQQMKNIFRNDFKFEDIGIGGLDNELSNIFRRAFASRRFP